MSEAYETIKRGLEDAVNGRVTEHMIEYAPVVHGEWIAGREIAREMLYDKTTHIFY